MKKLFLMFAFMFFNLTPISFAADTGKDGASCTPNRTEPTSNFGTGCDDGFVCLGLRGREPKCYRSCDNIGDISDPKCAAYPGPGMAVCRIERSDEFRRAVPEGVKVCAIRCGGVAAHPSCTPLTPDGRPRPGQQVRCNGECPENMECGRVLEFDGPLRCV